MSWVRKTIVKRAFREGLSPWVFHGVRHSVSIC